MMNVTVKIPKPLMDAMRAVWHSPGFKPYRKDAELKTKSFSGSFHAVSEAAVLAAVAAELGYPEALATRIEAALDRHIETADLETLCGLEVAEAA